MKRIALFLLIVHYASSLENGLARTPPMGWMSWQRFRCITDCVKYPNDCISEDLFKRTADTMVKEGYAAAGYEYIIIDDCWLEKDRDNKTGKLVPDKKRFPNGLNKLSNYIHAQGLKFGLYEDYGTHTCAGYPGVIENMKLDAETFADWDVDYVKLDGCYADTHTMDQGYPEFGMYLNGTGRPMVYSCSWPVYQEEEGTLPNYEALKKYCNLWRNWDDIQDSYDSLTSIMDYFSKNQDRIQPHAGPGHWNDPDMLLLGNYGLSYDQSKTQMSIWAILAAPLLMSTDLAAVKPEIKSILLNKEIIAVNQDPLGIQGKRIILKNNIEVWTRPITPLSKSGHFSYAIAFVSRRDDGNPYDFSVSLDDLQLENSRGYKVKDLFENNQLEKKYRAKETFETMINPSGVQFFKFTAL